ncbi:CatB-related O-acetyltransferase [Citrobacter sp. RHB35-C21]|nr:CatB-related O-acetyltransferase [Citrobacter sp. RHB35-C21]QMD54611.1 CatB-related O-acetyltransferase [Citrobacter sp. RHB35-C21]
MQNVILYEDKIQGSGVLESPCYAKSKIEGKFYVGAYTFLSHLSKVQNCFIGRYSRVDDLCTLGLNKEKKGAFSNHFFNYAENGPFRNDEYYQSIKPERYFYEKEKITLIGNDVFIHKGVTVYAGVSIGDGAVVYANSVVVEDVPDYAIVAGIPAKIIGYRFPQDKIFLFKKVKWWDKDISALFEDKKINLVNNSDFIDKIANAILPDKKINTYYYNNFDGLLTPLKKENVIIGPSHIYLWQKAISSGQYMPNNYFLVGIQGVSSFSENFTKTIKWLSNIFKEVYYFVPDFRIGNAGLLNDETDEQDGLFIDPNLMNNENDKRCYQRGISFLDDMATITNVHYIFWCLSGRESINKRDGKFIFDGNYKHPIWNLSELKEKYQEKMVLVEEIGINVLENTINDG